MAFRDSHTWKLAVYKFLTWDISLWYMNDIGEMRAVLTTVFVTICCVPYCNMFPIF
jgi:hypothetical protein